MFLSGRSTLRYLTPILALVAAGCGPEVPPISEAVFEEAARNAERARVGFVRADRYLEDWLERADPETGLILRNLNDEERVWNASDAAADNYPFMVMTASFTDRGLFEGRMREMLETERRFTSRLGPLPATYSFETDGFVDEEPDLEAVIFGSSEYAKDGLLPLTEWLGSSPWSDRMIEIVEGIWARAPVETEYGPIPSTSHEINGEMLQVLSRLYWMTGEKKYLDRAIRLGDYYLLGSHHPTRDADRLRLRDHGCEIVSGLTELYATVHFARAEKKKTYREPLHAMLDRILEVGRNEDGLFYDAVDPQTGEVLDEGIADTFGYTFNGFYTVYLIDGVSAYRRAVVGGLGALEEQYLRYDWEGGSADGDADAIESALNLHNRAPSPGLARWIDEQTRFMWSKQDSAHDERGGAWSDSGVIEGWHGDGNFARTTLYYALWKTRGVQVRPWREDVSVGATRDEEGRLAIYLSSEEGWSGRLLFDGRRHRSQMGLPLDWPRINQFPEWFTARPDSTYTLHDVGAGTARSYPGRQLQEGIQFDLAPGMEKRLLVY